jgi:TonB family protein
MSAAPGRALEVTPQRRFPRHPISVPLDLIALRSGIPETLPGRCTDISEIGLGAVIAGELAIGQQVALELRLPNVGVPVRARSLVRYQAGLHCGLEFSNLSVEQQEMIRYWAYHCSPLPSAAPKPAMPKATQNVAESEDESPAVSPEVTVAPVRKLRVGKRVFFALLACVLVLAALGWWRWQRSWNELETRAHVSNSRVRVPFETMSQRIVTKVDPVYPEEARRAGTSGLVVLDAIIGPDGSVKALRPVSGPAPLVQSATHAVQSWTFEPYLFDGKAVEVETAIAVEFQLN